MGSYCVLIPCLTRPRITRSVTRSVPTRVASARPCVSNKKSADSAWQLCQALDGYSLSLPKRAINRSASNLDRIKNQAIAKQSGYVHTTCTNVRTPSQFICCVGCKSQNFGDFYVGLCRFVKRLCVRPWPASGTATAIEVGVGAWASGSATWMVTCCGWLPKLVINFACNSVVRQIDNGEKTAELQRCGLKS